VIFERVDQRCWVDVLTEADELDSAVIQFVEHFEKVPYASGHSVECRDEHDIEFASPSVGHELI
jgi:hypothetical protein